MIPPAQNGPPEPNTPPTRVEWFDANGNVTWVKDERGYLSAFFYDPVTLAAVEMIRDVDTEILPAPDGWETPAGGGQHLVTSFENDLLGRRVQTLGPWHSVDLNGMVAQIRRAQWTVYRDAEHEDRSANGFVRAEEMVPCLINPVQILRRNDDGRIIDVIETVRTSNGCGTQEACSCSADPVISPGRLTAEDAFPQKSWCRWQSSQYNDAGELVSSRLYFRIPEYGAGQSLVNYGQTDYGYDSSGRRDRIETPGGTITRFTFTAMGWQWQTYIGTEEGPTVGSGNTKLVEERIYDEGQTGGAGNLTMLKQFVNDSEIRETVFEYDYRHFRTAMITQVGYSDHYLRDNLGRTVETERRATAAGEELLAKSGIAYDNQGRVFERSEYSVVAGVANDPIKELTWFDASGNVLKRRPLTARGFTKFVYDGLNQSVAQYTACATSPDDSPESVAEDIVVEQIESEYDAGGTVVFRKIAQRMHNASDTAVGPLGSPTTEPHARVSFSCMYPDPVGRLIAQVDYGTHGSVAPVRLPLIPASTSVCQVSRTVFNARGERNIAIDANGIATVQVYDDAARLMKTIENASIGGTLQ